MKKFEISKPTKSRILFWGSLGVGVIGSILNTLFERDWIEQEVERQINQELER